MSDAEMEPPQHDMDLKIAQHLEQRQVGEWHANPTHSELCSVLSAIVECDPRLEQTYRRYTPIAVLFMDHPEFESTLEDAWRTNSYGDIRDSELLRASDGDTRINIMWSPVSSIQEGWEVPFVGDAADVLWEHICHASAKREEDRTSDSTDQGQYYAQYCAILQSSGMGKSRAVEEMSKKHFVIPVVLRHPDSSGHPPSDIPAYDYLSKVSNPYDSLTRCCGFLHALLVEATAVMNKLEDPTAASFRQHMQNNMVFRSHGQDRIQFYGNVAKAAEKFRTSVYDPYFYGYVPRTDERLRSKEFPLRDVFQKLRAAIKIMPAPENTPEKRGPCILVAFDEIHTLTEGGDFRFRELRRALRGLCDESFFALFLSTSGASFDGMAREENVLSPFCELGFDQRAAFLDFSHPVSLSKVTSLRHLRSYGRPLWACSPQSNEFIIEFAVFKLLCCSLSAHGITERLACLAQRIPIEFLSTTYTSLDYSSGTEEELVHSHLRVLLKIEKDLETMVTTSPSEPILSEAAYFLMTHWDARLFSPSRTLQDILDFAVKKSELGELLVALLFILARDKAVGPADRRGLPPDYRRWCLLPNLLSSLFCDPSSSSDISIVDIKSAPGWRFSEVKVEPDRRSLAEVFADSKVYFTHFIKAEEPKLVHVEYLMRLMARGAALLCTNSQRKVDGIIPFLLQGDEIKRDNIGVIMFRIKNDMKYTHNPKADLLSDMNPRTICNLNNIPVIRICFAVAASRPALYLVTHTSPKEDTKSYTAYDFWAAGFSPEVFAPMMGEEGATWNNVLQKSRPWGSMYESEVDGSAQLRMATNPGAADSREHWDKWTDFCNA